MYLGYEVTQKQVSLIWLWPNLQQDGVAHQNKIILTSLTVPSMTKTSLSNEMQR